MKKTVMVMLCLVMMGACLRVGAQRTPVEGTVEAMGKLVKEMAVGAETKGWEIQFEQEVSFGGNGTFDRGERRESLGSWRTKKVMKGTCAPVREQNGKIGWCLIAED